MTNETVKINNFYSVCKIKFLYETGTIIDLQ